MKKSSLNRQTLRLFWQFTRPNKFMFWYGTIGVMVAVIITDIIPPLIIARCFDKIQALAANGQTVHFSDLASYVWAYIGLLAFGIFAWRTQAWAVWRYVILGTRRIHERLFGHVQQMGPKFHADRFGGALVSQTNKFAAAYDRFMSDFTWNILTGFTALLFSLVILYSTYWQYAAILTGVMTVYFVVIYRRMKRQAPLNRDLASKQSLQTAKLADTITNVGTVRAFAGEEYERQLFQKQTGITMKADFALMKAQMKNELFSQSGTTTINILAFAIGVVSITKFNAPVGTLFLAISYTSSLTRRLWESMFILRNLNRVFADAADMTEILQLQPEIKDDPGAEALYAPRGDIRLKDVTFSHNPKGKKSLFKDLNLHIKPGEKIGFVGHSGSGKTTLTNLLLRFMDVQKGGIEFDGRDIKHVTQASLRSHVAYVPQEPLLFHRSLLENIRYGNPDASKKEVIAVAKMAHAHDFISELPEGYDTLVGERGVKLSGGQRQRVAIARAMLKNAPVLILDEATSALDSESEALIQDALWKLMEGRTAIIIAHRLSTIQRMDRIIVMDNGRIAEQGSHKELIRQNGIYAGLWNRQSGGFLED